VNSPLLQSSLLLWLSPRLVGDKIRPQTFYVTILYFNAVQYRTVQDTYPYSHHNSYEVFMLYITHYGFRCADILSSLKLFIHHVQQLKSLERWIVGKLKILFPANVLRSVNGLVFPPSRLHNTKTYASCRTRVLQLLLLSMPCWL